MSINKIVAVSGGFDPLHVGHIRYLKAAWQIAQDNQAQLWVILNTDEWLTNKGMGHPFFNYDDRYEILMSLKYVDCVVPQIGISDSVADSLEIYRPIIFAKGGDRTVDTLPDEEKEMCNKHGIRIITGVGGLDKPDSSRDVIARIQNPIVRQCSYCGAINEPCKEGCTWGGLKNA